MCVKFRSGELMFDYDLNAKSTGMLTAGEVNQTDFDDGIVFW